MPAIPFAIVSDCNHYISHSLLQDHAAPSTLQMTKHFYKPGIAAIMRKFESVKALGAAPAEEWTKGLITQKQESLEDLMRWEIWESKGGLKKVNSRHHPKPIPIGAPSICKRGFTPKSETYSGHSTPQSAVFSTKHEGTDSNIVFKTVPDHVHIPQSHAPTCMYINLDQIHGSPLNIKSQANWPVHSTASFYPTRSTGNQHLVSAHQGMQIGGYHPRPERNIRDINEAKAARRADIERRCAALEPPLLPAILGHMESFQAAMQITQPMTEQAWEVLKPRLLAQLPYAERKEKDRVQQDEILAEEYRQRRQQEIQLKETKENLDREWETFQNPVRNRLGALADNVIDTKWGSGRNVTKDLSPKFAADVLLIVRQRFCADVAQEDEAAVAAGLPVKTDSPNGPPTRKLILENMKWLFDTKVKPLTDHFQRELFLCNGCDGNFKFYGFEGVIQHYAAKHTTTLSMGNIVVHWRAEWPEHPPFHPNPSVAKSAYYQVPTPVDSAQTPPVKDTPESYPPGSQSHIPGNNSLAISRQLNGTQYSMDTHAVTHGASQQDGYLQQYQGQAIPFNNQWAGGAGYSSSQSGYMSNSATHRPYQTLQPGNVSQIYGSSFPAQQTYSTLAPARPNVSLKSYHPGSSGHNYGNSQPLPFQSTLPNAALGANVPHIPGQISDLYQRQMDEMAKHAKDVFLSIGGVKDLPGSVRIHVVIQITVSRFKATFPNEPSLSMFIDGLDHNATMRPVRSVNGLGCKTCIQSGTGAKLFTLPHLVNHFRTAHVESPQLLGHLQIRDLDWKSDMIDLPDASIISRLLNAAGMTEAKLGLIASVFEGYFPSPLPSLRGRTNIGPMSRKDGDMIPKDLSRMPTEVTGDTRHFEDPGSHQPNGRTYSDHQSLWQDASPDSIEPPGEDEYDPHRPAVLGKGKSSLSQICDPARFSPARAGQRTSYMLQPKPSQRPLPSHLNDEQAHSYKSVLSSTIDDTFIRRSHDAIEQTEPPYTRKLRLMSPSEGRSNMSIDDQSIIQGHDTYSEYVLPDQYDVLHRHFQSGADSAQAKSSKFEPRNASPSGIVDADRFLSSLDHSRNITYSHTSNSTNGETEQQSAARWKNQAQINHRQNGFGQDPAQNHRIRGGVTLDPHDDENNVHQFDSRLSNIRDIVPLSASQRPRSRAQHYEDSHTLLHGSRPLTLVKADQRPAARYESQSTEIYQRPDVSGNTPSRPWSGSPGFKITGTSKLIPSEPSHHDSSADTALYRPRSPVEEDRGDTDYRTHSASANRPPKVIGYDYPQQARYEYINDRELRETYYQPNLEYVRVPMEYEDCRLRDHPARYLMPHIAEQAKPQYVSYEQTYANEPFYERNGQMFRASERSLHNQPDGASLAFTRNSNY